MKKPILGEVDLKDGVIPITKAAATLSELIKRAHNRHQPIIVTQNGYPAAVLLDIDSFTTMRDLAQQHLENLTADDEMAVGEQLSAPPGSRR